MSSSKSSFVGVARTSSRTSSVTASTTSATPASTPGPGAAIIAKNHAPNLCTSNNVNTVCKLPPPTLGYDGAACDFGLVLAIFVTAMAFVLPFLMWLELRRGSSARTTKAGAEGAEGAPRARGSDTDIAVGGGTMIVQGGNAVGAGVGSSAPGAGAGDATSGDVSVVLADDTSPSTLERGEAVSENHDEGLRSRTTREDSKTAPGLVVGFKRFVRFATRAPSADDVVGGSGGPQVDADAQQDGKSSVAPEREDDVGYFRSIFPSPFDDRRFWLGVPFWIVVMLLLAWLRSLPMESAVFYPRRSPRWVRLDDAELKHLWLTALFVISAVCFARGRPPSGRGGAKGIVPGPGTSRGSAQRGQEELLPSAGTQTDSVGPLVPLRSVSSGGRPSLRASAISGSGFFADTSSSEEENSDTSPAGGGRQHSYRPSASQAQGGVVPRTPDRPSGGPVSPDRESLGDLPANIRLEVAEEYSRGGAGGPASPNRKTNPWTANKTTRLVYLDNVKWVCIMLVVLGHTASSWAGVDTGAPVFGAQTQFDSGPHTKPSVHLPRILSFWFVLPFVFFGLQLLFFMAGFFTVKAIEKQSAASFFRERSLRLGIP